MSVSVTINGTSRAFPSPGDVGLAQNVTDWAQDVSQYLLQTGGGSFPLLADLDLGSNYGLKGLYFISKTASPAGTGTLRLAKSDAVKWRNNNNNADLSLDVTSADLLEFNSTLLTGQCYAEYTSSAGASISNNASTVVNFGTKVTDTDTAVSTGASWKFTVPTGKGGQYAVTAHVTFAGTSITASATSFQLIARKNGSVVDGGQLLSLTPTVSVAFGVQIATIINCADGDYIDVQVYQSNGGSRALTTSPTDNRICIKRLV